MHGLAVIHQRRHCLSMVIWRRDAFVTYLLFSDIARGQAKNPNHNILQFTTLLSQSGITVDYLRLVQLHQNLPQHFRRKHVADTILDFVCIISPNPCRRCIWIILSKPRRRLIFDDDLGHGNHSGELLLFVGCFVNFIVSYLICMFQDSVPAGSYNDPFLSSVCVYSAYSWAIWFNFTRPQRRLCDLCCQPVYAEWKKQGFQPVPSHLCWNH